MAAHGHFYWNELMTRDVDKAKAFYAATIGWSFDAMPMPDGTYWVAKMGDAAVGGLFPLAGPQFDGVPESWMFGRLKPFKHHHLGRDDLSAMFLHAPDRGFLVFRAARAECVAHHIGFARRVQ